ncbi:CdaR family transcriptional regulator [Conexibacter sp. SYSU D00693]|uniref:PucR family transcriptional regulator n=1 Tax=Conexibacter sp. SYSU D00693 TaxID=2812560 RepID=UPI00196B5ABB|nr:helix-turn-helix domain-containing protein [Conexibacter sp. SYSU D00693]
MSAAARGAHEPLRVAREVAEELIPALGEVSGAMAREMRDAIPELPEALWPDIVRTCDAHVRRVALLLEDGRDPSDARAPEEALAFSREAVRQGVALEAVLRKYRVGHAVFSRELLALLHERLSHEPDELASAVVTVSDWTFAYVDAVLPEVIEAFQAERESWVRSASAVRVEEVHRILDGRTTDGEQASRRLGYELDQQHLALVCWDVRGRFEDGVVGALEHLARDVAKAAGGTRVLAVPLGGTLVAAWAGVRGGEPDVDAVSAAFAAYGPGAGVGLAVGDPHHGVEGFRRSHEEALQAQHVALLTHRSTSAPVRYADTALTSLLTADLRHARRFVERELGVLGGDEDAMRRLTATLRVFFEEGSSFARTARRLGVHENTIAYRVRRAGELLGRPITERRLETRVALQLVEVLRRAQLDD